MNHSQRILLLSSCLAVSMLGHTLLLSSFGLLGRLDFAQWKNFMGAAFNINLLAHDPGGYVHNRFYVKRLIWDSIDFVDDGTLNDSVPATLVARLAGQTLTDAQAYLGTARP